MKIPAVLFVLLAAASLSAAARRDLDGVGFEQRIGERVTLETRFTAEDGRNHALGDWFGRKPVILWLGYASCPQLCGVAADGMVATLRELQATAGRDYEVLMVSIDPDESRDAARARLKESVGRYGRAAAGTGWHYLTGRQEAITAVAGAVGFHYAPVPGTRLFAHPSGFVVLTPEGRISAYFPGVDYRSAAVAAALTTAQGGNLGTRVFDLLLVCSRGDGPAGTYGVLIWRALGLAVAATVLALGGGIGRMLWRERREAREKEALS